MLNTPPLLSVGLAVYNGEEYLAEAIESILEQTCAEFELMISDNASTDRTREICERYLHDARVHYHRNDTNIGGANNENQTFRMSRGKYFRLAAHDDVCHPELFARCIRELELNPDAVLCYTRTVEIDASGAPTGEKLLGVGTEGGPSQRFHQLASRNHNCEPTYGVVRSEVLGSTPLQRNYTDSDRVLLAELALRGRFIEIDEGLFFKRYHEKNAYKDWRERMSWFNPARRRGRIEFPNWIQLYYMFHTALTVPSDLGTRVRCMGWSIVWGAQRSGGLGRDLFEAARRLARPRHCQEKWRYNWE